MLRVKAQHLLESTCPLVLHSSLNMLNGHVLYKDCAVLGACPETSSVQDVAQLGASGA